MVLTAFQNVYFRYQCLQVTSYSQTHELFNYSFILFFQ